MKLQSNELKRFTNDDTDEDLSQLSQLVDKKSKKNNIDIAEKRKSMSIYKTPDSKRKFKKSF